jgi:hypothetical protein
MVSYEHAWALRDVFASILGNDRHQDGGEKYPTPHLVNPDGEGLQRFYPDAEVKKWKKNNKGAHKNDGPIKDICTP